MTYNLFPRLFAEIYKATAGGDLARAVALQHAYLPFLDLAIKFGVMPTMDYLMRRAGLETYSFRRPRELLDKETGSRLLKQVEPIMANINQAVG